MTAPFRGPGKDKLDSLADAVYDPWIEQSPLRIYGAAALAERAQAEGANVLIVEADQIKGEVLELPLIAVASTRGEPNNVDIPACTAKGIPVFNTPGRNADAVAEMTIALLFAANRHLIQADSDVRNGQVYANGTIPYQRFRAWELNGRTAGIVGLGAIGRALKWRFEGLGMKVISYDPLNPDATHSFEDLLAESDIVSMHAPVLEETKAMMGEKQFALMPQGSIYLNAARAALHDSDALVAALESGHLAGAGLDHFEGENLSPEHPLARLTNVALAPHIGGATYDTESRQSQMVADDIEALLNGNKPRYILNPEVL